MFHSYEPKPLVNFIIRDPKTRKISKSDFRDRIIYHALYNIIEPIFEKGFIYDSYANRKDKGTLNAIKRFEHFKRKASENKSKGCYVLRADIRKYFENVDHTILLNIIKKKIRDNKVIWLIRKILENSSSQRRGMPLGNLTSQFFANVYLNELYQFVKQKLKVKYYIRYVDDFVILDSNRRLLADYKIQIDEFLKNNPKIELHPDKSSVVQVGNRLNFLGFRVFYYHKQIPQNTEKIELCFLNKSWREARHSSNK